MFTFKAIIIGTAFIAAAALQDAFAQAPKKADAQSIERGRYLAKIAGCNDCHTPGYMQTAGQVPEKQWLTGDQLGWRGAWGTTYASNLRLYMQNFTEDQWLKLAKSKKLRPPMPWFALHDMTPQDLRAIYRFIRYLGPAGAAAPTFVLPGQEPKGPYVLFPQPPK